MIYQKGMLLKIYKEAIPHKEVVALIYNYLNNNSYTNKEIDAQ